MSVIAGIFLYWHFNCQPMLNLLNKYFDYTNRQKSGILVLVFLIICVFIAPKIIELYSPQKVLDYLNFESQISHIEKRINKPSIKEKNIQLFKFNPNNITKQDFISLGLTNKQAQQVINYRKAGGVFHKASDLLKIYSIDSVLYNQLEPYVQLNNETILKQEPKLVNTDSLKYEINKEHLAERMLIELNTADSIDLIKLKGVGSILSKRIISYRNYLGGFVSKQQLLEVYGLKTETYNEIESSIVIDTTFVQTINLNTADFKTLNKHPYLSYVNTKTILKYRQLMGKFKSASELTTNNLIDTVSYKKISPYLIAH